jgi:hypothetical protein
MKRSQNMLVWLRKLVLTLQYYKRAKFVVAGESPLEKNNVKNMI